MGYKGNLSAIAAGFSDIPEGANRISDALGPLLENLNSNNLESVLDALVDAGVELEHLENHCRDMRGALNAVYKHLEEGHDKKG